MKRLILLALTLTLALPLTAAEFDIDSSHTFLTFKVSHINTGLTVGQFRKVEGSLDLDAGKLEITAYANSLDSNDAKRDEHLKGPDFFNVKQFPVLRFTASKIEKKSDKVYQVTGTLLLHGRKQMITIDLTKVGEGKDPWGGYRTGYEASFKLNRDDYGMSYGAAMVGNEVEVYFSTEAIRK